MMDKPMSTERLFALLEELFDSGPIEPVRTVAVCLKALICARDTESLMLLSDAARMIACPSYSDYTARLMLGCEERSIT